MNRHVFHGFLALAIGIVTLQTTVVGQDKLERRPPKAEKSVTVKGKIIEESMAGVKMKIGGVKEELIPSGEILRIFHGDIPAALQITYDGLFTKEDTEKDLSKLLKDYRDFYSKASASPDVKLPIKRYLEYRIAMLSALAATTDEEKDKARTELTNFITANRINWVYPFAARALARLQLEKPDYDAALKTLDPLSRDLTIPAEVRQEADLLLIDVMFQANRLEEMKAKIDAALKDPKTTQVQKDRFQVYQLGIDSQAADAKLEDMIKKLDDLIAKTSEPSLKALAFNVMGDCYMLKNRKRDAMWAYLWVDVVYYQDRSEHMKAISKLLEIFKAEKDDEKVQLYKDKLSRMR
ncbi:MAG: hypothetical protein K8T89_16430 [Planctomycetes bacterium]|nr:hypothetical protein [Planctomycetota bacterium]